MSLISHAEEELRLIGMLGETASPDDVSLSNNLLSMLNTFCEIGHSGGSAPYAIATLHKLLNHEPLAPLMGTDDEWVDVSVESGYPLWQNKRLTSVFKGENGDCYDVNGPIFEDQVGNCFSASGYSSVPVKFPYTPGPRQYVKIYSHPERVRTDTLPFPVAPMTVKHAMIVLSEAMKNDPDYAWGWHCNIAMAAQDAGAPHDEANARAAGFMRMAFGVDTSNPPTHPTCTDDSPVVASNVGEAQAPTETEGLGEIWAGEKSRQFEYSDGIKSEWCGSGTVLLVFGIVVCSRYAKVDELLEAIMLCKTLADKGIEHKVSEVHYDSKACLCEVVMAAGHSQEPGDSLDVYEACRKTLTQFSWGDSYVTGEKGEGQL